MISFSIIYLAHNTNDTITHKLPVSQYKYKKIDLYISYCCGFTVKSKSFSKNKKICIDRHSLKLFPFGHKFPKEIY